MYQPDFRLNITEILQGVRLFRVMSVTPAKPASSRSIVDGSGTPTTVILEVALTSLRVEDSRYLTTRSVSISEPTGAPEEIVTEKRLASTVWPGRTNRSRNGPGSNACEVPGPTEGNTNTICGRTLSEPRLVKATENVMVCPRVPVVGLGVIVSTTGSARTVPTSRRVAQK